MSTLSTVYSIEVEDDGRMICHGYRLARHHFDPRSDNPERCRACGNFNPLVTSPDPPRCVHPYDDLIFQKAPFERAVGEGVDVLVLCQHCGSEVGTLGG